MRKSKFFIIFILYIVFVNNTYCQESKAVQEALADSTSDEDGFYLGADLVSRYIWRGIDYGNSPAIQPSLGFRWNGLDVGAWGSYGFTSQKVKVNDTTTEDLGNYSEVDLYLSYTYKWFTLMMIDYFTMNGNSPNEGNNYFDYKNATTAHIIEGSLIVEGPENLPLRFMVSTILYGDDKGKDSSGVYGEGDKNNFSTYLELGYNFNISKINVDVSPFIGGSLFGSSVYGDKAGVINLGVTARKEIPITKSYNIGLASSFVTNPVAQSTFLVFILTL